MAAAPGNRYAAKYDNGEMEILITDLLDYCEHSKSIHLSPWCRRHKFSKHWLEATAEHYPQLREALIEAREILSAKIVDSSFYDKESGANATVGMGYLPVYDKDYKAMLEWKEKIKQKELSEQEAHLIVKATNYANRAAKESKD